jgi:hypothetical protein
MTLWTPDGEHPIPPTGSAPADDLTEEQQEQARQMAHEMAEARQELLEAEVATIIANHALGIYELAALHITAENPDLVEARLAVDALGVLVEGLAGRLGDGEPTLVDALANIKIGFVQRVNQLKSEQPDTPPT